MNRRGFLAGILAAGVAPAVVGSGILMPVRALIVPRTDVLTLDAIRRARERLLENIVNPPVLVYLNGEVLSAAHYSIAPDGIVHLTGAPIGSIGVRYLAARINPMLAPA